ncbi:transcriptional repressor [candidate division KSB1 bacterium]|nr:transcriptional repressor [candidate division KSB1 bacterium]
MSDIWWQKRFYSAGCRITIPRKIVIKILTEAKDHLSADDIYDQAIKLNSPIGMTTIYRTLELLTQLGLIQKFDCGDNKTRYEMPCGVREIKYHHHMICVCCKTIIDYYDYAEEEFHLMQKVEESLSKKYNFQIMHHTINFYGLCSKCQNLSSSQQHRS